MRIIYIRTPTHGRPDPQRHARRCGPPRRPRGFLRSRSTRAARDCRASRAARYSWPRRSPCISSPLPRSSSIRQERKASEPEPIMATMMESPQRRSEPPPELTPPPVECRVLAAGAAGIDFRERTPRRKSSSGHLADDTPVRRRRPWSNRSNTCARPRPCIRLNRSAGASAAPCVLRVMVDANRPARADPGGTLERLRSPGQRRARSGGEKRCSVRTK